MVAYADTHSISRRGNGKAGARQTDPEILRENWATGETAVPTPALGYLAEQGIKFLIIGPAPYELVTPVRNLGAVAV